MKFLLFALILQVGIFGAANGAGKINLPVDCQIMCNDAMRKKIPDCIDRKDPIRLVLSIKF